MVNQIAILQRDELLQLSKHDLEEMRKQITLVINDKYIRSRIKKRGNLSPYISQDRFEKLLSAELNLKLRFCFDLMRAIALRIGEIVQIQIKDIDFNNNKLFIHTEKADILDTCYFNREMTDKLADYIHANYENIKKNEGYIFCPDPKSRSRRLYISHDFLRNRFRSCCNSAGFQYVYGRAYTNNRCLNLYTSHSCRHSGITDFYNKTRDLVLTQKFARHKDIKSTLTYIHLIEEQLREAVQSSDMRTDPEEMRQFLIVYESFRSHKERKGVWGFRPTRSRIPPRTFSSN